MLYIFDFDGTIADTAVGIVRTMQATFLECGYQEPHPEAIRATIGLPLSRAIALLAHLSEGEALDAATATYRRLFESIGTTWRAAARPAYCSRESRSSCSSTTR